MTIHKDLGSGAPSGGLLATLFLAGQKEDPNPFSKGTGMFCPSPGITVNKSQARWAKPLVH